MAIGFGFYAQTLGFWFFNDDFWFLRASEELTFPTYIVAIAVQDQQFDVFSRQGVGQSVGSGYPMAMRHMARVTQRTINNFDVVLIFSQYGD